MKIKLYAILAMFLLCGCKFTSYSNLEREDFFSTFKAKVYAAHKVKVKSPSYFNNNKEIIRPKNTWQNIMQIYLYADDGREQSFCLNYRVPLNTDGGELSYFIIDRNITCPLLPEGKSQFSLKNIKNVKLFLSSKEKKKLKLEAYRFRLNYSFFGKKYRLEIPFVNLRMKKLIFLTKKNKGQSFKKYSTSSKKGKHNSLVFLTSFNVRNDGHFMSSDHQYGDKNLTLCHKVEKDCSDSIVNKCDRCSGNWFEIVDYNCPQGGSKFCGQAQCGEVNQPACPRGVTYIGLEYIDVCFDGSPAGICRKGLTPVCIGDKYLVCK